MTQLHPTEPAARFEMQLTSEQVSRFFDAIAWQLPLRPACPPTAATIFREGEFLALQKLGIALNKVLHGEQKYRFHGALEPGVSYQGETFVTSHYQKSGASGTMQFFVFQTDLKGPDGNVRVECHTTIIARG